MGVLGFSWCGDASGINPLRLKLVVHANHDVVS